MKTLLNISLYLALCSVINAQSINFMVVNLSGSYSITCKNNSVNLIAVSGHSSAVSYSFVSLVASLSGSNVNISAPGQYTVTAYASGNLTSSQVINIYTNTLTPTSTLTPSAQTISCGADAIITATASPAQNVTHSIKAPPGAIFSSNAPGIVYTASAPGTYSYTVTENSSGCSYSTTFNITGQGFPIFDLTSPQNFTIGCSTTSFAIVNFTNVTSTPPGSQVSYTLLAPFASTTLPTGSLSATSNYNLNAPGTWTAVARDANSQCTVKVPFTITQQTLAPDMSVYVSRQILDCFSPTVILQAFSSTPNASYKWKYPGLPGQSNGNAYTVSTNIGCSSCSLISNYTLEITNNSNACKTNSIISIFQNIYPPQAGISVSSPIALSCSDNSVMLTGNGSTGIPPGSIFPSNSIVKVLEWRSPGGASLQGSTNYTALIGGVYSLTVEDTNNGCVNTKTILVQDTKIPNVQSPSGPFNLCSSSQISIYPIITSSSSYTFSWISPPGSITSAANTASLTTNAPGFYTLTITDSIGCSKIIAIEVVYCVGIKDNFFGRNTLYVYPNPGTGHFTVRLKNEMPAELTVYNLAGEKILNKTLTNREPGFDLSTQPEGIYFINLLEDKNLLKCKLIKY